MSVAIIVPVYRPTGETAANLAVMSRMAPVIAVDDGSPVACEPELAAISGLSGVLMVRLRINSGIAAALNRGAEIAIEGGAEWLFTFDQDSAPRPHHIDRVLQCFADAHASVGLVGPGSIAGRPDRVFRLRPELAAADVHAAIQSGLGMATHTFLRVGPFAEEFVIDGVDTEYCLRASTRHGLRTRLIRDLDLPHRLGGGRDGTVRVSVAGRSLAATGHSAQRRYYFNRNAVHLLRRYGWRRPVWAAEFILRTAAFNAAALLLEAGKLEKLGAVLRGLRDGLLARTGKMERRSIR